MRYLALFFTIYIMALLAWPCCGNETSLSSSHEDLCYTSSDQHHSAQETAHACSPFFHCSNYHSFVASPAVNKAPLLILSIQNASFPEYPNRPVILFPGDIWQPPQLV